MFAFLRRFKQSSNRWKGCIYNKKFMLDKKGKFNDNFSGYDSKRYNLSDSQKYNINNPDTDEPKKKKKSKKYDFKQRKAHSLDYFEDPRMLTLDVEKERRKDAYAYGPYRTGLSKQRSEEQSEEESRRIHFIESLMKLMSNAVLAVFTTTFNRIT